MAAPDDGVLPIEAFLEGLRISWRGGEIRPTARAKPTAKRERRRPDRLLAVTTELEEWYQAELRRDNQDGNPATIRMRMRRCRGDEGRA